MGDFGTFLVVAVAALFTWSLQQYIVEKTPTNIVAYFNIILESHEYRNGLMPTCITREK